MRDDILIDVSRETIVLLQRRGLLVEGWIKSINLLSSRTVPGVGSGQVLDSAQKWGGGDKKVKKGGGRGAGAGFPGLVVAILAQDKNFCGEKTLGESDKRKCVFLSTVKRELNLNLSIINNRKESGNRQKAEVISARALAEVPRLLELSFNHLSNNATLIFAKGKSWQEELVAAEKTWKFSWEAVTSKNEPK
jgi:Predicted S-adenosylmethionine-dependent methyltransferase involved in bacterial cell division